MRRVVRALVGVALLGVEQRRPLLLQQQLGQAPGLLRSMVSVAELGIRGRRHVLVGVLVLTVTLTIRSVFRWQYVRVRVCQTQRD